MSPEPTPSQTVGPFFYDALVSEEHASYTNRLVPEAHPEAVRIEGMVYDGAGDPVPDAMVEIRQADPLGSYATSAGNGNGRSDVLSGFEGFGRSGTREGGRFSFVTVKPGVASESAATSAPRVLVSVFARGLLKRLVTLIYFPDEKEANAKDGVLLSVKSESDRRTLLARKDAPGVYRFDIHLQGERQTAFFDL